MEKKKDYLENYKRTKAFPPRLVPFTREDDEKMCEFLYELLEDNQISSTDVPFSESVWSKCHARGLLLNHSSKSLGKHMRLIFSKFNDIRKSLRSSVAKKLSETYRRRTGSTDDSGVRPSARYDTRTSSAKSSLSAGQSVTKEKITTPVRESSQDLTDAVLKAKSWMVGRESWLKHDPIKDNYFCEICRAFYPNGNAGRCGRFLDGIPLKHFSVGRVRDHENSSMHGRAVVSWNIDHENEAVPLLLCNGYYLERCEVPNVKQALAIGQKSKDNNFTRILFNPKKTDGQTNTECQSNEVLNDSETNPTVSPKKSHSNLEQPRKISDNDSIYWLRQDNETIFCSACKKYGKAENMSSNFGFFDRNSDNDAYNEHGNLPAHNEALKLMFKEQNCVAQMHMKRLEKQQKEFESGFYNCPTYFCSIKFEKKADLERHVDLVHRRNVYKEKQPIISCVCDINQEDDAMIQCFQCSTLQHRKCFDIQQNHEFDSFYCCYSCADDNENATSFRVKIESDIVFATTGHLPSIDDNDQVPPPMNDLQTLNTCYQDVLNISERLNRIDRQIKSIHSTGDQIIENEKELIALQEEMDKKLDDIDKIVTDLQQKCPQQIPIEAVRDLQKNLKFALNG
uniref:C2H2-type domain-containing protein n=1 Tax=Romanomermis culicivorax TaxID=13658 RepID=A0A915I583_ROMCU